MHYQRFLKHGDPTIRLGTPPGIPLADRFWAKVDISDKKECWMWTAGTDDDGYGIFGTEGTTAAKAHRVAYVLHYGVDPGPLQVLHRCDTPGCVNPRHLYVGTPMDNMQDKIVRGRDRYLRGEECPQAQLTARKVKNIRRLRDQHVAVKTIARQYRTTVSNVNAIIYRKSWKHI